MNVSIDRVFTRTLRLRKYSPLCRACSARLRYQSRAATTQAASVETAPIEPNPAGNSPDPLTASASPTLSYKIKASVLLSRPPLLTRDLTPFEKAYFLYQRRLNERLVLPFTRYFYYPRGTPGDVEWKRKAKQRASPARDIGKYSGYGAEAWNDEVLVGDATSETEHQIAALVGDARDREGVKMDASTPGSGAATGSGAAPGKRDLAIEGPQPRFTEADRKVDMKSLYRLLTETLYLLVKPNQSSKIGAEWIFPERELLQDEALHTAAESIVTEAGGPNMNTWIVGNQPIVHQTYNYPASKVKDSGKAEERGEKTFYMKARIMAGQADLTSNRLGLEDFRWLSKKELQTFLHPREYSAVQNVLLDR